MKRTNSVLFFVVLMLSYSMSMGDNLVEDVPSIDTTTGNKVYATVNLGTILSSNQSYYTNYNKPAFSAYTAFGYQFRPRFSVGGGVGLEKFLEERIPIFGEANYQLFDSSFSPFASGRLGYAFRIADNYYYYDYSSRKSGSIWFDINVGVKKKVSDAFSIVFGAGLNSQTMSEFAWAETHTTGLSIAQPHLFTQRRFMLQMKLDFLFN